jgi:hypothetical protein
MDDAAEGALAARFRPFYIFDRRENALRANEPLTLFRVRPVGLDPRAGCALPADGRIRVLITYGMIFRDDGGYVGSFLCGDRHRGDNQAFTMEVESDASGRELKLLAVYADHYHWTASGVGSQATWFAEGQYPVIFLSGGKHHLYLDTRIDGRASIYSHWGCHEAMDGRGRRVLTEVVSPLVPHGFLNVGEPHLHPAEHFVSDLGSLGFPGENAWGRGHFCGGQGSCGSETSPMEQLWGN